MAREWPGFEFLEHFTTAPDAPIPETDERKKARASRLHREKSMRSKGHVPEETATQKIVNKVGLLNLLAPHKRTDIIDGDPIDCACSRVFLEYVQTFINLRLL